VALRADDVDLERDRDLVERYQAGDPDAFDDLYRRYFDRLHGYCQRRVGDRHEAEELAQEAFVKALRAMPSFAGERRFYPWMTVIAQRLCIDHHRRRARVEPSDVVDLGSVEPDHDALFDAVDHEHLRRALARLAPRHREVLDLREQEGLSYTDIAQRLDVPVSTVEALLHRARKALRREFLSVAGHNRIWLIPGLGILSSRFGALRARLGDRAAELAAVAAPVAVGAAAAVVTLLGPAGGGATAITTAAPERAAAVGAPLSGAPVLGELALPGTTAPPAVVEPSSPSRVAPSVDAGPVDVWLGPEGADQAGDMGADMPAGGQLGPAVIGTDPVAIIHDAVAIILGGSDDEES
jgi:RNA polymerase sigma-70 factor (ECF subfamily)